MPAILNKIFEKWWPDLEKEITLALSAEERPPVSRPIEAVLSEILELTRFLAKNSGVVRPDLLEPVRSSKTQRIFLKLSELGAICSPLGDEWNHPVLVKVGPVAVASGDSLESISISHRGIERNAVEGKVGVRGVAIEIFFYCEDNYHWSVVFWFHKGTVIGKTRLLNAAEAAALGLDMTAIWRD